MATTTYGGCSAGDDPAVYINCILDSMYSYATNAGTHAEYQANEAVAAADGADWNVSRVESPYKMTAVEPDIPEVDNAVSTYESQRDFMVPFLTDIHDQFLNKNALVYVPGRDAAVDWLHDVIINGSTGIPPALEKQIWSRDRDRILAETVSTQKVISESAAAKGWSLPPGFAMAEMRSAQSAATRALGVSSTSVAAKQADIQIESVRFAVTEALKVYQEVFGAAIDYLRAMTSGLDQALKLAEVDPNVKANMINATSNLFRARIQKDTVHSGSLSQFNERVFRDGQLYSNNESAKLNMSVEARKAASDVLKGIGMAGLAQFSGIVSQAMSTSG